MQGQIICRVLTGPTASGKSDLALRIAEEMGWDILCMDSMQIYRGMNIGTAKPTAEEQKRVPHHLLDLCDPGESYSVSRYVEEAGKKILELQQTGKQVLFVGGTGLYLMGMMMPMGMGNVPANEKLREELHQLAEEPGGKEALDRRLRKTDPATADKLPMNDLRRRIRAIEVSEATGIPFSEQQEGKTNPLFRWRVVSTVMERPMLYERINRRVSRMLEMGLEQEVRGLLESGVPENAQSMSAIGYKEMIPLIRGEATHEETAEEIRLRSRHYAKRQMTFLKRIEGVRYVRTDSGNAYDMLMEQFTGEE